MSKALSMINGFYKTYVYSTVAKDLARVGKKAWGKRDDPDYFLRRVGLSRYAPVKSALGGFSLFLVGFVGGGILALMLAPMKGEEIRGELMERTKGIIGAGKMQVREKVGAQA